MSLLTLKKALHSRRVQMTILMPHSDASRNYQQPSRSLMVLTGGTEAPHKAVSELSALTRKQWPGGSFRN